MSCLFNSIHVGPDLVHVIVPPGLLNGDAALCSSALQNALGPVFWTDPDLL